MKPKRKLVGIAVLVLASLVATGCESIKYGQVGDSITNMCHSTLENEMGIYDSVVYGVNGSTLEPGGNFNWQSFMATLPTDFKAHDVVLALGTNDAVKAVSSGHLPADFDNQIDFISELARRHVAAGGHLWWVNVAAWIGYGSSVPTAGQKVNGALGKGALRNKYGIIDWSGAVSRSGRHDLLMNDGVHLTSEGCSFYASLVHQSIG